MDKKIGAIWKKFPQKTILDDQILFRCRGYQNANTYF